MKVSKKGEYALRTLIDLGIAETAGRTLVGVSELSAKRQLPERFLGQIMNDLREAGFVESERGKYGGYRLARPARSITIGSIIRAIDGPLAPIGCVSQSAYEPCSCPDEAHCGLRMLMVDVRNAISGILDRFTLADVVGVTVEKLRRHSLPLPFARGAVPGGPAAPVSPAQRLRARRAGAHPVDETEGVLYRLLGDYSI